MYDVVAAAGIFPSRSACVYLTHVWNIVMLVIREREKERKREREKERGNLVVVVASR